MEKIMSWRVNSKEYQNCRNWSIYQMKQDWPIVILINL